MQEVAGKRRDTAVVLMMVILIMRTPKATVKDGCEAAAAAAKGVGGLVSKVARGLQLEVAVSIMRELRLFKLNLALLCGTCAEIAFLITRVSCWTKFVWVLVFQCFSRLGQTSRLPVNFRV